MNGIKKGIWPTMITPYDREGRVDLNAAKRIVDWYARRNCDGIFAVCQSQRDVQPVAGRTGRIGPDGRGGGARAAWK